MINGGLIRVRMRAKEWERKGEKREEGTREGLEEVKARAEGKWGERSVRESEREGTREYKVERYLYF